jgi:hypothetical protein
VARSNLEKVLVENLIPQFTRPEFSVFQASRFE